MDKFRICGGPPLRGEVTISGAKNAALPILFATLLSEEPIEIQNVPELLDVRYTIDLLRELGAEVYFDQGSVYVNGSTVNKFIAPQYLAKRMRASIWVMGPLLARFGRVELSLPGGCAIGARPIDLHLSGLRSLGARVITESGGGIAAWCDGRLKGAHIVMEKVSVGATLTVMIAATLANGETTIENAALEPEISDTALFLNSIGAKIMGAGSRKITILGVDKLVGGSHRVLPDRIETGTFLVAAAVSGGDIICRQTNGSILEKVLNKLRSSGAEIRVGDGWVGLNMRGRRPSSLTICTSPYPGFPTDMQAQFTLLNLIADGTGSVTETIWENRFMHVSELVRMGGRAEVCGNQVTCHGSGKLHGARVNATDLRASASLVLAGCVAEGVTEVCHIKHIDRGYERIEEKLQQLGADIVRVEGHIGEEQVG